MDFEQLAVYANLALTWIGFGTVVGLAAKAIMPGRDPGGAIATVLMGIVGTLIGCATLQYFSDQATRVEPISLQGFAVGSGGAFVILIFYKVLGGYWFVEGESPYQRRRRSRRRTRRAVYDD
ncbi:MAG: GlsB/YeaQ/YmgE family stress response membrane protein [Planctomycetota bacterium]